MYRLSPSGLDRCSGPSTKSGLLLAGTLGLLIACSSEKEPNDDGLGGTGGTGSQFDASVPNLPGDGREPTPTSDINDRQVPFLPSDEYFDSVNDIADDIGGGGRSNTSDASTPDADAGPDGST